MRSAKVAYDGGDDDVDWGGDCVRTKGCGRHSTDDGGADLLALNEPLRLMKTDHFSSVMGWASFRMIHVAGQ